MVVLSMTAVVSYLIIILRLSYFTSMDYSISVLISVITIFIVSSETQVGQLKDPSSFVMASVIFKTLKAVFTIIVFSLNGNLNDIFVAYFFLVTSLTGTYYF